MINKLLLVLVPNFFHVSWTLLLTPALRLVDTVSSRSAMSRVAIQLTNTAVQLGSHARSALSCLAATLITSACYERCWAELFPSISQPQLHPQVHVLLCG